MIAHLVNLYSQMGRRFFVCWYLKDDFAHTNTPFPIISGYLRVRLSALKMNEQCHRSDIGSTMMVKMPKMASQRETKSLGNTVSF